MHEKAKKYIYSFFGPPGSGKGTVAAQVASDSSVAWLSTGNMCRQHVADQTSFGIMLQDYLVDGMLIPDDLITDMVKDWLKDKRHSGSTVILDGYPRTKPQAELFVNLLDKDFPYVEFSVINFIISYDYIIERLKMRLVCSSRNCQAVYSSLENEKVCKLCSNNLVRRDDDSPEVVANRLQKFDDCKKEILSFYKNNSILIFDFLVGELSPDQVYSEFIKLVGTTV